MPRHAACCLVAALVTGSFAAGQDLGPPAAAPNAAPREWPSPLPTVAPQPPVPFPPGVPPPPPDVLVEFDERLDILRGNPGLAPGQQHWLAVNLVGGQPSVVRAAVKVLPRPNNSLWVEAYAGSVLFEGMYGFGARLQHTAWGFRNGDTILVSPGIGLQIVPDWYADLGRRGRDGYWVPGGSHYSSLFFLAGDVDVSWLHDFGPRLGFELGLKVGLAGRVGGTVGRCYPRDVMWGKDLYPILALYTGLRF